MAFGAGAVGWGPGRRGAVNCTACGFVNPDAARFCGRCGASLGIACRTCGALVAGKHAYCTTCGASLSESQERKTVTVLFADLVGFTRRAERLDPEEVRGLLAPYHARLRRELERFGGTVEKFIGDAVVALFGAPAAHEDDPERGVRAALAVREAIADLDTAQPGLDLHVRIAVTTGEAVVALDAQPSAGEGMAAGDVLNTASRLQAAAPVDGILVDAATYFATSESIEYRAAAAVEAKGKAEPIAVWEALSPQKQPDAAALQRRRGRFVGRRAELAALEDALARAERERSVQLVTLVGEPGIGKSRLVYEFYTARAERDEAVIWQMGRCLPYGDGVTFWALGEMVKSQAGVLATDEASEAAAKLETAVEAVVGADEAAWVAGHLRSLVGLGGTLDAGGDRRGEAFAAWRRYFQALADGRKLVLVFDDLHWADDGLLDFIDHLVEWVEDTPLLVVGTSRPELLERRPGWTGTRENALMLPLPALSDSDTSTLVASLLENTALSPEAHAALLAHAGGNPLYASEYVRMLVDRGLLRAGDQGDLAGELPLPESVQGIVATRLDALPAAEKRLLQDAAVIGKAFWAGALVALGGTHRWRVEEQLLRLERLGFVRRERRSSVARETQYAFWHVLFRDVAYSQIPRWRRADSHRAAAAWIESLNVERAEDRAEMLAHHYLSALEFARAAGQETAALTERARLAVREAGDRATSLQAFPRAVRFYRAALELWPRADPERAELLLRLGQSQFHAEAAGDDVLSEARDAFLARSEHERAAEAIVLLGELLWTRGEAEAFLRFEEAAALLEHAPPSHAKAHVLSSLARFLTIAEKNERAIGVGLEALAMADELGREEIRAHALAGIGRARIRIGDDRGFADLEQSIAVSIDINSPECVRGYVNLGNALVETGALERAFDLYENGRRAARRFGDADRILWLEGERLYESYWRGLWDECLRLADSLVAQVEAGSPNAIEQDARFVRSRIRLARGDSPGALEDSERALELGRRAGYPEMLIPALALCSRVLASAGRLESAASHAEELLTFWPARVPTSYWIADLGFTAPALDRVPSLLEGAGRAMAGNRWLEGAVAAAGGDFQQAAEIYADIGSRPDEAVARLRAAEALVRAGVREEGEAERASALELARRLGAKAYVREAETLLPLPR
ncbi:MAG TPA: AAA family ATPase [Gaiellaceae bacterium]|nr:AAA family ATPase [Gaiellaceae bacterium]